MNYIEEGKKPPKCKSVISTPEELVEALRPLIGQAIPMTGKSRTDGSNFRKIVTNHLLSNYMPEAIWRIPRGYRCDCSDSGD